MISPRLGGDDLFFFENHHLTEGKLPKLSRQQQRWTVFFGNHAEAQPDLSMALRWETEYSADAGPGLGLPT